MDAALTQSKGRKTPHQASAENSSQVLSRSDATLPGYWTTEELAREIGVGHRTILNDINGRPDRNQPAILRAYQHGKYFYIADRDAVPYIAMRRNKIRKRPA